MQILADCAFACLHLNRKVTANQQYLRRWRITSILNSQKFAMM